MNPVTRFWIDQLKSGRHRQCRHRLWDNQNGHDAYDPFGVACMLYSTLGNPLLMDESSSSFVSVDDAREFSMAPPSCVLEWLGVRAESCKEWIQPYMLLARSHKTGVSLYDFGVFLEMDTCRMFE